MNIRITYFFHKQSILGLFLLFLTIPSFAQIQVFPTAKYTSVEANPPTARVGTTQALSLPFFDDFSLAQNGRPDPTLWQKSGVFVNNTLALNQPSLNFATFDGTKADGTPYNFENELAYGGTDTLTSQPINMAGLSKSNVYFSYWGQRKGISEIPDIETDSLVLQFKDSTGVWSTIKSTARGDSLPIGFFRHLLLPVEKGIFFYANFQFRFIAYGRQSGPFDSWHIDYVYLGKDRNPADYQAIETCMQGPISSILKRYQSMPLNQYLANPALETDTDVTASGMTLQSFITLAYSFTIDELITRTNLIDFKTTANSQVFRNEGWSSTSPSIVNKPSTILTNSLKDFPANKLSGKRAILKTKYILQTSDDGRGASTLKLNLKLNDTLSAYTVLDDYYAYDDGTAEYAAGVKQKFTRVAVRFILNKPDVISSVQFNIRKVIKNLSVKDSTKSADLDTTFTIQILDNLNRSPNTVKIQQSFRVLYGKQADDFTQYQFKYAVPVKDTFYVAWYRRDDELLPIGLDKSRNKKGKDGNIFTNKRGDTQWSSDTLVGNLMVRPIMGNVAGKELVTATEELADNEDITIFPNPNKGILQWDREGIKEVQLYDPLGKEIFRKMLSQEKEIDIQFLPPGVYLLNLSDGKKSFVRKIILTN